MTDIERARGLTPYVPDGASLITTDEPTALTLAIELIRRRRSIAVFALTGLVIGAATGLLSRRQYASTATFLPQSSADQAVAGGLALAAQFGIRVPTGGTSWGPSIYAELITSRGLLTILAGDTVTVAEDGGKRVAVSDLLEVDEKDPAVRTEKTIRALRKVVSGGEVKRISAVQLTARTRWPSVSLALANRLLAEINRFNVESRKSQAGAERQFAEQQSAAAERSLREAEDKLTAFSEKNRIVTAAELSAQRDRLQRDVSFRQTAYTSLQQSLSEARLREVRETPVISVLEAPVLAAMGEPRQSALKGIIGAMLGAIVGMIVTLISSARESTNPHLRSFVNAVDEALPRRLRRK